MSKKSSDKSVAKPPGRPKKPVGIEGMDFNEALERLIGLSAKDAKWAIGKARPRP